MSARRLGGVRRGGWRAGAWRGETAQAEQAPSSGGGGGGGSGRISFRPGLPIHLIARPRRQKRKRDEEILLL